MIKQIIFLSLFESNLDNSFLCFFEHIMVTWSFCHVRQGWEGNIETYHGQRMDIFMTKMSKIIRKRVSLCIIFFLLLSCWNCLAYCPFLLVVLYITLWLGQYSYSYCILQSISNIMIFMIIWYYNIEYYCNF